MKNTCEGFKKVTNWLNRVFNKRTTFAILASTYFLLLLLLGISSLIGGNPVVTSVIFWLSVMTTVWGEVFEWLDMIHIEISKDIPVCFLYLAAVISSTSFVYLTVLGRFSGNDFATALVLCLYICSYSVRNLIKLTT